MTEQEKKWRGRKPVNCDLCGGTIGSVFYDASIPAYGSWALICHGCFRAYRCKLGTGRGQKYDSKTLVKKGG